MKKITGWNLEKVKEITELIDLKELYRNKEREISVYAMTEEDYDTFKNIGDDEVFNSKDSYWIYANGSNQATEIGVDVFKIRIKGTELYAWINREDFETELKEYGEEDLGYSTFEEYLECKSYSDVYEYLEHEMGACKTTSRDCLIRDLAKINRLKLEEFYKTFL